MKNPFQKPKEFVMSLVVVILIATFSYLAIKGVVEPQSLKEVLIYVFGVYSGGKMALSGNGNGANPPST